MLTFTFTVTLGWWILPAFISLAYIIWAIWVNRDVTRDWGFGLVFAFATLWIPVLAWTIYFALNT